MNSAISLLNQHLRPVTIEAVRSLRSGWEVRMRLASEALDETVFSNAELEALLQEVASHPLAALQLVDPAQLALLIESVRIRLAHGYDQQFAVSLSGIRTLLHQIEAVCQRMLPQPRLRFLLADDPGAGKTIMASQAKTESPQGDFGLFFRRGFPATPLARSARRCNRQPFFRRTKVLIGYVEGGANESRSGDQCYCARCCTTHWFVFNNLVASGAVAGVGRRLGNRTPKGVAGRPQNFTTTR